MIKETNYEPYGQEWEAELMKWRKVDLIKFLKSEIVKNRMAQNVIDAYDPETGDPGGVIHQIQGLLNNTAVLI